MAAQRGLAAAAVRANPWHPYLVSSVRYQRYLTEGVVVGFFALQLPGEQGQGLNVPSCAQCDHSDLTHATACSNSITRASSCLRLPAAPRNRPGHARAQIESKQGWNRFQGFASAQCITSRPLRKYTVKRTVMLQSCTQTRYKWTTSRTYAFDSKSKMHAGQQAMPVCAC
jgi:hypothetical protein